MEGKAYTWLIKTFLKFLSEVPYRSDALLVEVFTAEGKQGVEVKAFQGVTSKYSEKKSFWIPNEISHQEIIKALEDDMKAVKNPFVDLNYTVFVSVITG